MARIKSRQTHNKFGMLSVAAVVLVLLIVVLVKGVELHARNSQYIQKEAQLLKEVEAEEARKEELEEYAKYVKTKKYVEEVAKNKLGLVYEDEIIFKSKN